MTWEPSALEPTELNIGAHLTLLPSAESLAGFPSSVYSVGLTGLQTAWRPLNVARVMSCKASSGLVPRPQRLKLELDIPPYVCGQTFQTLRHEVLCLLSQNVPC